MAPSSYAAWYAAIVATAALAWQIYIFFSKGVHLKVTATFVPGMSSPRIDVSLYNRGDSLTTIESFLAEHKNSKPVPLFVWTSELELPMPIAPNEHKQLTLAAVPEPWPSDDLIPPPHRLFPDKQAYLIIKHSATPKPVRAKIETT